MNIKHRSHFIKAPPEHLLQIVYPPEHWFTKQDSEAHQRIVHVDRGFPLCLDWWKGKNEIWSQSFRENAGYGFYGIPELEEQIWQMHQIMAPHQKIQGRHLVFGSGAMQLLCASLYATCLYHSTQQEDQITGRVIPLHPLYVTQQLPAYLELRNNMEAYMGNLATWVDFPRHAEVPADHLIEYVTTLNNPDGRVRRPATKAKYIIHDRVNHMPFFFHGDVDGAFDQDTMEDDWISIFSLSKFFGFSGSRVGYAFVKDPLLAHYMKYFVFIDGHGVAVDGQLRCVNALKYLLKDNNLKNYIDWCAESLRERWGLLRRVIAHRGIQLLNSQGANAWVKLPVPDAEKYLLEKCGILATYGPEYGVGKEFARFNMLGGSNEFNEFLYRLTVQSFKGGKQRRSSNSPFDAKSRNDR